MTIKTSRQTGLLLSAGLLSCLTVGVAAPTRAANDANTSLPSEITQPNAAPLTTATVPAASRPPRAKSAAHAKSGKTAQKSAGKKGPAAAPEAPADNADSSIGMPPSVANANAQLTSTQAARSTLPNAAADASANAPAADSQVVAPDQVNDLDRAALSGKPQPASLSVDTPDVPAASLASSADQTGKHSALIGAIFIGLGALLTMASTARMFMRS